ncbi:hypothetical protein HJG60_011044 [Phyllostomus discolor]|uniref:Uncharacterized protein n=1 Tax=Phyllostomus discolor TaxID=89673 RepID=A0A834AE21_9CHIR|nr:hypothetical protein HJG60_011044 [Phyllostomus discolor]
MRRAGSGTRDTREEKLGCNKAPPSPGPNPSPEGIPPLSSPLPWYRLWPRRPARGPAPARGTTDAATRTPSSIRAAGAPLRDVRGAAAGPGARFEPRLLPPPAAQAGAEEAGPASGPESPAAGMGRRCANPPGFNFEWARQKTTSASTPDRYESSSPGHFTHFRRRGGEITIREMAVELRKTKSEPEAQGPCL